MQETTSITSARDAAAAWLDEHVGETIEVTTWLAGCCSIHGGSVLNKTGGVLGARTTADGGSDVAYPLGEGEIAVSEIPRTATLRNHESRDGIVIEYDNFGVQITVKK